MDHRKRGARQTGRTKPQRKDMAPTAEPNWSQTEHNNTADDVFEEGDGQEMWIQHLLLPLLWLPSSVVMECTNYYVCRRNEEHSRWLWKGSMDIKNALKISPKSPPVAVLLTCIPAVPFKSILQQIKNTCTSAKALNWSQKYSGVNLNKTTFMWKFFSNVVFFSLVDYYILSHLWRVEIFSFI